MEQAIAEKPESLYTRTSLLLILITCISYIGLGFVLPLRALYAREIGATTAEIGFMASAPLLTGVLAAPIVGRLSDRIGYSIVLWIGLLVHALIILAYIPTHS